MKEPVTSKHSCFQCAHVARATRGRGLHSLGLMARLGVPVGVRVRKFRAVEDQSAPIPKEISSKLGGSIYIVRRAQLGSSHPTPYKVTLAAALPAEQRVLARRGWVGEKHELFEHPGGGGERPILCNTLTD
jgi:hypothetical protein